MSNNRPVSCKCNKGSQCFLFRRGSGNVRIPDSGEFCNPFGNMNSGINKSVEHLYDFPTCKNAGADLRKPFRPGIEPSRLRVEGDKLGIQRELAPAQNSTGAVHIVNIICFKAIDDLDLMLLSRFPHVREGLRYTVVCHCNCRHTPVGCPLHHSGGIG